MPVIIAILFGIGLLMVANTEKLPWFLQIIRAGLVVALRWFILLCVIGSVIWLCFWGYSKLTEGSRLREQAIIDSTNQANEAQAQAIQDSIAKAEYVPEYGTDEYWKWRLNHLEQAKQIELERKEAEEAPKKQYENSLGTLYGSWSRSDKYKFDDDADDWGVITFTRDKTFYCTHPRRDDETGTYKLSADASTLYLYFDDGRAESLTIESLNSEKMISKHSNNTDMEAVFLKRPSIAPDFRVKNEGHVPKRDSSGV